MLPRGGRCIAVRGLSGPVQIKKAGNVFELKLLEVPCIQLCDAVFRGRVLDARKVTVLFQYNRVSAAVKTHVKTGKPRNSGANFHIACKAIAHKAHCNNIVQKLALHVYKIHD